MVVALFAAACSSSPESDFSGQAADLGGDTDATTTTDAEESITDFSSIEEELPEGLAFTDPQTLRISVPTLDFVAPYLVDETDPVQVFVADLLSDGLTTRDPFTGLTVPGVASSWSTSTDGLVWTFLITDARFGNGAPIEANDVVTSLNRVAERGIESISGPTLWPIVGWTAAGASGSDEPTAVTGIEAVDNRTVQITLTERYEELPEVLSAVGFGVWPADGAQDAGSDAQPMTSAIDVRPTELWSDGIRLETWEPSAEVPATIELLVDPTNSLFEAGETDMTIQIDPDDELGADVRGIAAERSAEAYFAINSGIAPLDDALIRQAIVHAIDRTAIRDEFFPTAGVMGGFVSQRVDGAPADRCGERCEFDPEQARTLVEASPNSAVPFTVDYFVEPGVEDSEEQQLAEAIAAQLRNAGLDASAEGHSLSDFGSQVASGELGLFRFGTVSTVPSAEAELSLRFHTAGSDNLTATSIERVDSLIEEARTTNDPTERRTLYAEAETVLFGEAVVLPLVEFRHHLAHGPTLVAAGLEPDGSLDLGAIEFAESN